MLRSHALIAIALLVASCAWRPGAYTGPRSVTGTCEGACDHYVRCKGDRDAVVLAACVRECEEIFVEDGEPDAVALGMFEQLQCPDAIGFVEGTSGRGPGSSPPDLGASSPGGEASR